MIANSPLEDQFHTVALDAVVQRYGFTTFQAFADADLDRGGVLGSRATFDVVTTAIAPLQAAIAAVRELAPPAIQAGGDPELHELLTGGWETCHHTALSAIDNALQDARSRQTL
ncbi:hypothetical protein [Amycolatopsis sp. TNS106]|uniref:hypothetical protein n=1 Tax=Amycolatopsis sp. TNS106 TaxID=2861750 RepID=UPI001C57CFCB|nr:hypothetical protein [Amycolatopsis sp. TNS106]